MTPKNVFGAHNSDIYREILFAGFPLRREARLSSAFVRSFFAHYGAVHNFVFDTERGIGSVTFATGEIAVNCYLAVHLSLLPAPDNANSNDDEKNEGSEVSLLYMEFAQGCPFVNPKLLLSGDRSRHHLRYSKQETMKHVDSAEKYCTNKTTTAVGVASHIVVLWRDPDESDEQTTREKRRLVRDGPNFPVGAEDVPDALNEALWVALEPHRESVASGDSVTVLDLWWEFYQQYVLHKTEPEASRIKDPYLKYAQKVTVAQEINKVLQTCTTDAYGDAQHAMAVVKRLVHDDVYRSVCGYLCFKLCFHNDPSWASLVRDVTSHTAAAKALSAVTTRDCTSKGDDDARSEEEDAAEMALLQMPILSAAANVIENVRFLRAVRRGGAGNGSHGGPDTQTLENDTTTTTTTTNSSTRLEEEELYMEVLHTLDGFAPNGDAAALMSMCESPETFRHTPGHIGWSEVHKKRGSSVWWVRFQAIAFVLTVLVLVGWGVSALSSWMGFVSNDHSTKNIHRGAGYGYDNLPADVRKRINIQVAPL